MLYLSLGTHGVVEEVLISKLDSFLKFSFIGPAKFCCFAYIQQLARGAVGTGGVPLDFALVAHYLGYELGEGTDGELLAGAGIDGFVAAVVVPDEQLDRKSVV